MEVTPGCLSIQVPNKNIIIRLQRKVKLEALSNFYKYNIWHKKERSHTNRWDTTNDKAKKLTTETTLQRTLEHKNTDFKITVFFPRYKRNNWEFLEGTKLFLKMKNLKQKTTMSLLNMSKVAI